jgi:hypothetical protein
MGTGERSTVLWTRFGGLGKPHLRSLRAQELEGAQGHQARQGEEEVLQGQAALRAVSCRLAKMGYAEQDADKPRRYVVAEDIPKKAMLVARLR